MPFMGRTQPDATPPSSSSADVFQESAALLLGGMPKPYYLRHNALEIRVHAEIIHRREDALVAVESCPGPSSAEFGEWICVVTDDRPGLLSLLSAAISAHSLDILGARVYCRTRPGRGDEAVDLFSVRGLKAKAASVLGSGDLGSIRRTMELLLRGEIDVPSLEKRSAQTSRPLGAPPVTVYFEDSRNTDLLIVEAGDRPGLLLAISLTIFRERLTIVRSHVTTFAATARDEFELAEVDGARLSEARRSSIADKIRAALSQEKSLISSSSP
jgi:UTP:GlnB (protein PII) uridylyltransferase